MAARRRRPTTHPVVDVADVDALRGITIDDLALVLDADQLKAVVDRLGEAGAVAPPQPGQTVGTHRVTPDVVSALFPRCVAVAAGIDPVRERSETFPPVLWDTGSDRLLVHVSQSKALLGDGFVDVQLVVQCDQTGFADVTVTLVTASSERPAGFVVATEDRPRGPEIVVNIWGEALVALAWRALVEVARLIATAAGRDQFDRPYVASTVVASPDALVVTPMVPHRFMRIQDDLG
jgi:hypothetical protein